MQSRVNAWAMTLVHAVAGMSGTLARELAASWRLRYQAALMVLVCIGWGLFARNLVPGIASNAWGIAWYGTMWYTLAVAFGPRTARWKTAVAALSICWAIELFQLTPWPSQWAQFGLLGLLSRAVLGVSFQLGDMPFYPVGIAGALAGHWVGEWNRRRKQGRKLAPLLNWALCDACPKDDTCALRGE